MKTNDKSNDKTETLPDHIRSMFTTFVPTKGEYEKLTLPPFIAPDDIPVGAGVEGTVLRVIGNFTGDPEMDHTKNLVLQIKTGEEIMIPVTGVLGQSIASLGGPQGVVGRDLVVVRLPDSISKNYKNKMFMFDVYIRKT